MSKPHPALCYVSLAWADLERARALVSAVRAFHSDWRFVAAAEDAPTDAADADFAVVPASRSAFLHAACLEGSSTLIVQLDVRAKVTAPLTPLLAAMDDADILLLARFTQAAPDREGVLARDLHFARTGAFNTGFLAVRSTGEGPAFAAWWADRVANYPADIAPQPYADQRWCDLVPGLFDRVAIVRHAPAGLELPVNR
jgi:hypothetical protein